MSPEALDKLIADLLAQYGPIIGVKEAAVIARRSEQTIYDWSSKGHLNPFRSPRPGPIALATEGFVRFRYGTPPKGRGNGGDTRA